MSDSAEGTKPNRRKGNPKPRTGCITCKQRHVKCDEGKPSCQRCIKYGVQCGGYKEDKPKIKPQPSRVRKPALILPKKSGQETASQALHLITQSSPVFQSQANPFQQPQPPSYPGSPLTQEDQTYLQHFRENPAHVLGGYSAPELWTKMVLQACEKEAYILKAVVAVAALDKITEVRTRRLNQRLMIVNNHSASQEEEARHHQYAVQQYSKAVAEMRESVAQGPQDMQITLLGCLLTVCFEAFHGNQALALQQIRSGVVLIKAWLQDKQEANTEQEPSDPMEEKLLLDEFVRLDLQLMEFASAQTGSGEGEGSKESVHSLIPNMPSIFGDLNAASRSLFTLNRQGLNFLARVNELEPPYQPAIMNPPELSGSLMTSHSSDTPASPAILEDQAHLLQRYAQWATASKAVFPAPSTTPASSNTETTTTEAKLLWIRYLVGHITTSLCLSPHEMAWDQFQSSYQQLIDIIRSLFFPNNPTRSTSNQHVESTFTTLEVFITPLFLVATKCRDPALRHRALELLATCPVRDSVLDALMAREVAAWVIGVEEEGMIDGVIGEESQVRGLVVEGGKRDRRAVATCRLPRPGVDGNWFVRRKELAW